MLYYSKRPVIMIIVAFTIPRRIGVSNFYRNYIIKG